MQELELLCLSEALYLFFSTKDATIHAKQKGSLSYFDNYKIIYIIILLISFIYCYCYFNLFQVFLYITPFFWKRVIAVMISTYLNSL